MMQPMQAPQRGSVGLFDDVVRDIYKDTYGTRPSHSWMLKWDNTSDEDRTEVMNELQSALLAQLEEDEAREADAAHTFMNRMTKMADEYDIDRVTAMRWEYESNDVSPAPGEFGFDQEFEFFLYTQGILGTHQVAVIKREYVDGTE